MHFGPWEIAAFGGLWVSAVMLALDVGLRMSPPVRERLGALDRFTATGLWAFTPLALLTISGIIFLADRLTLLPVHDLDAGVATTWQFVAPLLLLMLVAVIWSTRRGRNGAVRPEQTAAAPPAAPEVPPTASPIALDEIVRSLESRIDRVSARTEQIAALKNNQGKTGNVKDPQSEQDLLILLDYAIHQSAALMLEDLLRAAPSGIVEGPIQMDNIAAKRPDTRDFIDLVRRKLDPGSWRRSSFEAVMQQAEHSAEHQLEQTPIEVRPSDVDPLTLRKYAISYAQCAEAIRFLRREKTEVTEMLLNQRSTLLERYRIRNPG